MKYSMIASFLLAIYLVFLLIAIVQGFAKIKKKEKWYLVHESVLKVLFLTGLLVCIFFAVQSYHVDYLVEEVKQYESQK